MNFLDSVPDVAPAPVGSAARPKPAESPQPNNRMITAMGAVASLAASIVAITALSDKQVQWSGLEVVVIALIMGLGLIGFFMFAKIWVQEAV